MEFKEFNECLKRHVMEMTEGKTHLFVADTKKGEMWDTYLNSFPPGTNELFRERREFDCHCCHNFIRDLGNVVAIDGSNVITIWDFEVPDPKYQTVINAMTAFVRSRPIRDVFTPIHRSFGTRRNAELWPDGSHVFWYHLQAKVADSVKLYRNDEIGEVKGQFRASREVLQRSFEEITGEALDAVLELIDQGSLYKGEEWKAPLVQFSVLHRKAKDLKPYSDFGLFCWKAAAEQGPVISRIKNRSIGVLLSDISAGMELDDAVRRYELIVAPSNYKRPKAVFTKKMIEQAEKKVIDLGLERSLGRRHARLEDITVNNILFANRDAAKRMPGGLLGLRPTAPSRSGTFDKVESIPVDKFVRHVLPTVEGMELFLDNEHRGNMVSLIAPKDSTAPSMFKWSNGFSWAYAGSMTDSMKQRVKSMGGKVDGVLRFSIQWNDKDDNLDDLDAHCIQPNKKRIYYFQKRDPDTLGELDIDIVSPKGVAVENITWPDKNRMPAGIYKFFVHCFSSRSARSGFTAEIEFGGKIYSFAYSEPLRQDQQIPVADVYFDGKEFSIFASLKTEQVSNEVWGLSTKQFHPVHAMMYSPNFWDGYEGVGHRHYFFMLKDCRNPESPNGFFNEYLIEELMQYKRVFEALGSKMRVEPSDDQLSGVGFSATKRAEVVIRLKGAFSRVVKVVF